MNIPIVVLFLFICIPRFGYCKVVKMEVVKGRSEDRHYHLLPVYGISFVDAHLADADFQNLWEDGFRYVIWIDLIPATTGTYNFCLCNLSGNKESSSWDVEGQAKSCLADCRNVDYRAFSGNVQKFRETVTDKDLKYYNRYKLSYWDIPFSIGKIDHQKAKTYDKLMFCVSEAENGKVKKNINDFIKRIFNSRKLSFNL